jgi:hypothetical protein
MNIFIHVLNIMDKAAVWKFQIVSCKFVLVEILHRNVIEICMIINLYHMTARVHIWEDLEGSNFLLHFLFHDWRETQSLATAV